MGFYDVVMLVIMGGAVFFGFWKGLAWQIASLAAIVLSYVVSINFREPVSRFIQADEPLNRIGAMLILFLGTSIVVWTIYSRVKSRIKKMELGGFDRQAGALLGAVKGALICMVATMFSVSLLGDKTHDTILHESKFGPYVVKGINQVQSIVPGELAHYIDPHIRAFQEKTGQTGPMIPGQNPGLNPNGFQNPLQLPNGTITNNYQINGGLNQNPSTLPPGQQAGYQATWNWQTPNTPTSNGQYGQQPAQNNGWNQPTNNNPQYATGAQNGSNYNGTQSGSNYNPPNGSNYNGNGYAPNAYNGQPQGSTQGNTNSPLTGPSEDLFNGLKQQVGEAFKNQAAEAARRALENGFNGQR